MYLEIGGKLDIEIDGFVIRDDFLKNGEFWILVEDDILLVGIKVD